MIERCYRVKWQTTRWKTRVLMITAAGTALLLGRSAAAQTAGTTTTTAPAGSGATPVTRDMTRTIALAGPSSRFADAQPATPGQAPQPPAPAPPREIPRVIPLEPLPSGPAVDLPPPQPRVIRFPADNTGLTPDMQPVLAAPRSSRQVVQDVTNLLELLKDPEAELSVIEGRTKIIQTRRDVSRVIIANPAIADIELLADQPGSRLINLYGKMFGTTTLTIWDQTNRPVTFLVRVSLDTKDLETRIQQAFPGAEIKVRQVGYQVILDGQVPDSKTMADVLQLVTQNLMFSQSLRMGGMMGGGMGMGMGMAGGMGGGTTAGGGGMGGGGAGTGGMGGGMGMSMGMGGMGMGGMGMGGMRGLVIINRVTVPGPRQVLLHVKIAEINRSATRSIGVSWVYARGQSLFGSAAGNNAMMNYSANTSISQLTGKNSGAVFPPQTTVGATNAATPSGNAPLFGVFNSGHFSLFIDALRTNSLAKILAEPNLVALDGQPARFLVGGLFPFPVPQSSSIPGGTAVVTVQFQRFGTILTFLPEILQNDVIRLDVEPVISQLNFAQGTTVGTGAVPSITERSARTVVELREGQTLVIAGLLQALTNATTTRIPGLGDLPIVGPWFSNTTNEIIEYETIVLVTPELVSPLEKKDVTEHPGDRIFQPNDAEFYLLNRIEGKLGREFRSTVGEQDPLNLMRHFQSEQHWVVGPHGYAD